MSIEQQREIGLESLIQSVKALNMNPNALAESMEINEVFSLIEIDTEGFVLSSDLLPSFIAE